MNFLDSMAKIEEAIELFIQGISEMFGTIDAAQHQKALALIPVYFN